MSRGGDEKRGKRSFVISRCRSPVEVNMTRMTTIFVLTGKALNDVISHVSINEME